MTNQETNEGVARVLGLGWRAIRGEVFLDNVIDWHPHRGFSPATDLAAASWALERYCDEHGCVAHLIRSSIAKEWSCCFRGGSPHKAYKTQQESICACILREEE